MDPKKFPKKPSELWGGDKGGKKQDLLAFAQSMKAAKDRDKRVQETRKKRGLAAETTILKEE